MLDQDVRRLGGSLWRASATLVAHLALVGVAWGQAWTPNESLVSSQKDLLDPEYNQARAQFCWSDAQGRLWVGNIDRDTGLFYPPDGKGILIDSNTITSDDTLLTLNGPEWVLSSTGDGIAYTTFVPGKRHNNANARLGYARPQPDSTWSAGPLGPDVARKAPYGSETPGDPKPRITYVDSDNNHYWREVDNPATEQLLPGTPMKVGPVRHVRGARAVVYTAPAAGLNQVFYRNLDSGAVTQLTFDSGDKDQPYMWMAPEYGGEFVFMAMVGNNELRIYRQVAQSDGSKPWTVIDDVFAPKRDTFTSPEPFTYRGKSYVFMAMIIGNDGFSSEIWISNIDASQPLFRRISDNAVLRARTDPEAFATSTSLYVYYNRRQLDTSGRKPKACGGVECSEGIYRAEAGLGP